MFFLHSMPVISDIFFYPGWSSASVSGIWNIWCQWRANQCLWDSFIYRGETCKQVHVFKITVQCVRSFQFYSSLYHHSVIVGKTRTTSNFQRKSKFHVESCCLIDNAQKVNVQLRHPLYNDPSHTHSEQEEPWTSALNLTKENEDRKSNWEVSTLRCDSI